MPRKVRISHARTPKRRQKIIQAALGCFVELGFSNTTMKDICRRAKASNGSIYHHFSNKEMLAAVVYLEGLKAYQAGLLAELERNQEARAGVYTIIGFHIRWVTENPDWARYLWQMRYSDFMEATEASIAELNRPFFKRFIEWFQPHIKAGAIKPLHPEIFIPVLIGPCQEYARVWLSGKARMEPSEAAEHLAHAAWLAVQGQK
jgi:AcrR family transcriptional regulator